MSGKSRAFFLACPIGEDLGQVKGGPKQAAGRPNMGQKKDARRPFEGVFHAMLSHTQDAWTGPEDRRDPTRGSKKPRRLQGCASQDGWNGDPQQAAERPNEEPQKKPRAEHPRFLFMPWRVENDLSSVGSQELFCSPAPLARTQDRWKGDPRWLQGDPTRGRKKCLQGGPRCFSRHAGHTQDAWTGPGDCRETQLRVRKSHEFFSRLRHWQGPRTGGKGLKQAAGRPNKGQKKDARRAFEGGMDRA